VGAEGLYTQSMGPQNSNIKKSGIRDPSAEGKPSERGVITNHEGRKRSTCGEKQKCGSDSKGLRAIDRTLQSRLGGERGEKAPQFEEIVGGVCGVVGERAHMGH